MERMYDNIKRFITIPYIDRENEILISYENIQKNYQFKWQGSVSSVIYVMKFQQVFQFLNTIQQVSQLNPNILQKINFEYMLKKIWTDGFGFKDESEVFIQPSFYTTANTTRSSNTANWE